MAYIDIATPDLEARPAEKPAEFILPDSLHPQRWVLWKKIYVVGMTAIMCLAANLPTSILSPAVDEIAQEFNTTFEVSVLSVSLYVLAFAVAPILLAPLSEEIGRKPVLVVTMLGFVLFQIGTALAPNIATLLVCRFIGGCLASPSLSLGSGVITDCFSREHVPLASSIFLLAPFQGPVFAQVLGGFIIETVGWRWTMWVCMIFCFVVMVITAGMPESYLPVITRREALKAIKRGDNVIIPSKRHLFDILKVAIMRPLKMMRTETIIMLCALYISFNFGVLYAFLLAYPYVFTRIHGFSKGITGLMFLGLGIGVFAGSAWQFYFFRLDKKSIIRNKGVFKPERSLSRACLGAPMLPISLFWFAWTSRADISWAAPCVAGFVFGMGNLLVFLGQIGYITLAYPKYAASAMSINGLMRYFFAFLFPLFSQQMFDGLGISWAMSLMAFISLAMVPIPFIFMKYGPAIRQHSEWSGLNPKKT